MPGPGPQADSSAHKVFICYRREETAGHAGRLYDAMVERFGKHNVFIDIDIPPGVDFVERITEVVSRCLVLLVAIGPVWATVKGEDGQPRLADPHDFVRLEATIGLRRPDLTVVPVLLGGARMPKQEELPPELHAITYRNAVELSDARWGYDVGRLNTALDGLLGETSAVQDTLAEPPPKPDPPAGTGRRLLLEGILVAGATAFAARYLAESIPAVNGNVGQVAGVILRRTETWALAGAALAVWLAIRTRRVDPFRLGMTGLFVGAIAGAIGGAIWAVPVLLPEPDLIFTELAKSRRIEVGSLAVTGGIFGAMIGALWPSPRFGAGLVGGLVAGALFQLLVIGTGWNNEAEPPTFDVALAFSFEAIAIVGLTLAILLALDRQAIRGKPPAYVT
jgi:hypothetical protein